MTDFGPLVYEWDGDAMRPLPQFARRADQQFTVHEKYKLEVVRERSKPSHDQQFAWLEEKWLTLHEKYQFEPWAQSPEHLRKYALIRTGFCITEQFACGSKAEASRLATILRSDDEYCLVTVTGSIVNRFRAESQKIRGPGAMSPKRFQESKQKVFDFIDYELLGIKREPDWDVIDSTESDAIDRVSS